MATSTTPRPPTREPRPEPSFELDPHAGHEKGDLVVFLLLAAAAAAIVWAI